MERTYKYDPSAVSEYGKDRLRFELGDTQVEGGAETCALCDEEYNALLPKKVFTSRQWKKVKLKALESIYHRFAYEADVKDGPLSLSLGERAKLWREEYLALKDELSQTATPSAIRKLRTDRGDSAPPYFYNGMMSHEENVEGRNI